jgi:prepilin-type N-terminal cleavage/methylation domain-containing protein/prepilin-type processing-associated H-X9-DG protein
MRTQARVPHGFTLIELLVVIAIIAILAGILFPVFTKARAKGKQMMCLSNIRQLCAAIHLYNVDHQGMWVPAWTIEPNPGVDYPWNPRKVWIGYDNANNGRGGDVREPARYPIHEGLIDVYLKDQEVKRCPSQPSEAQTIYCCNWWYSRTLHWQNPHWPEYGPFCKTLDLHGSWGRCIPARESEIEGTGYTMVIWEHWASGPWCQFLQPPEWFDDPPDDQRYIDHFEFLHYEGANTGWADGHAKWLRYKQLRRPMFSVRKSFYPPY